MYARAVIGAGAVAALLAGCGSSSNSSSTAPASTHTAGAAAAATSTTPAASTPGTAVVVKSSKDGTIIAAGPKHLTVYLFEADHSGSSSCSGACAGAWPPVTSGSAPVAGSGVNKALLGSITRSDGSRQVTYAGHPLYFFLKDKDDGDAYGQGVNAFGAGWYVLTPGGSKVDNS